MIYAIILVVLGLITILFNKKPLTKKVAVTKTWLALLFIIWGMVGIVILSTARLSVMSENTPYWCLLILGSVLEILIAVFFIEGYIKLRKGSQPDKKVFQYQSVLGILAIVVGILTILVK